MNKGTFFQVIGSRSGWVKKQTEGANFAASSTISIIYRIDLFLACIKEAIGCGAYLKELSFGAKALSRVEKKKRLSGRSSGKSGIRSKGVKQFLQARGHSYISV